MPISIDGIEQVNDVGGGGGPAVHVIVDSGTIDVDNTPLPITVADGADVTQGTETDPEWDDSITTNPGTIVSILKLISSYGRATVNQLINIANNGILVGIPDGADTAEGSTTDVAVTTDINGTVSGKLRGLVKIFADVWDSTLNTLKVRGTSSPSAGNSTTALLGVGATFTGVFEDVSSYGAVAITAYADSSTSGNGAFFDWSSNGVDLDYTQAEKFGFDGANPNGQTWVFPVQAKYFRIRWHTQNAQTVFRLATRYLYLDTPFQDIFPLGKDVPAFASAIAGKASDNSLALFPMRPSTGDDLGLSVQVPIIRAYPGAEDTGTFSVGATGDFPVGAFADEISNTSIADGKTGMLRMTPKRGLHTNLRNNSGTEIGTLANPIRVDPTGTTTQPITGVSVASAGNSTTTPLGGGTFTGTYEDVSSYSAISVNAFSDVTNNVDSVKFEWSSDGINFDYRLTDSYKDTTNGQTWTFPIKGKYFRVKWTDDNGQLIFRLATRYFTQALSDPELTEERDIFFGTSKKINRVGGYNSTASRWQALEMDSAGGLYVEQASTWPVFITDTVSGQKAKVQNTTPGATNYGLTVRGVNASLETGGNLDISVARLTSILAQLDVALSTRLAEATFTTRINTQGQKTMALSTPVVLSSDQSTLPVSIAGTVTTSETASAKADVIPNNNNLYNDGALAQNLTQNVDGRLRVNSITDPTYLEMFTEPGSEFFGLPDLTSADDPFELNSNPYGI